MHDSILHILNTTKTRIQNLGREPFSEYLPQRFEKRNFLSEVEGIKATGRVPVIAEIKPASPGKVFREISAKEASKLAMEMEEAGAVAISVLTEPEIFGGSLDNLNEVRKAVLLPVLRKDFIIDPIQFEEIDSDLVLLIAGILGEKLDSFVELAFEKGFEPLVEVHNAKELEYSLKTNAKVLGINNRNLETMKIDLSTTEELMPLIRQYDSEYGTKRIIISESGMKNAEDVRRVIQAGADAVLIGSALMESDSVFEKAKEFVQSFGWRK